MSTTGKLARIGTEYEGFTPYLTILSASHKAHFVDMFEGSAARFLAGTITAQDFGVIVGELCRDAKGTAAACRVRRVIPLGARDDRVRRSIPLGERR